MTENNVENLIETCEQNLKSALSHIRLRAVISLQEIGEPAVPLLLTATQARDAKVSAAASQALSNLGEVGISALRSLLYDEVKIRRKRKKLLPAIFLALLVFFIIAVWLQDHLSDAALRSAFGNLLGFAGVFTGMMIVTNRIHVQRGLIIALQKLDDVKLIGLFALCLNEKDKDIRSGAKDALTRLMPRVQASDAQYVSRDEMQALVDALHEQKEYPNFMLSLLKGLEQIGDERALANVAALTEDSTVSPSVKPAARDCLPYLQIRAEQAKQAQTLLRASSGNEVAPETLLRPASGVSTASNDAQELLRPQR